MADNIELDPGSGGVIAASDDIGGVHHPYVKVEFGADNTATPVSAANPLPVVQTGTPALPTGAATAAKQPALGTAGSASADVVTVQGIASGTAIAVSGTVTASGPLTDTQLRATPVPVSGTVTVNSLPAGANNIGDVDVLTLPALPAGSNNIGDVDVLTIAAGTNAIGNVGIVPRTSGGLTPLRLLDIDETEDAVKASAGQLFGWYLYNDGAAEVYVKFYNDTVANVTVGSTTPVMVLPIPAGAAANVFTESGIAFSAAITVAATTAAADADTGAPATAQVVGTVFYA